MENDGKVLRFYGLWNDGLDKRKLIILYFLSDDTIQINETPLQGSHGGSKLLRRTKLPKENEFLVSLPGSNTEKTILNVVTTPGSRRGRKNHLISDKNDTSIKNVQYFDCLDLVIGQDIDICGKTIFLYDCDDFTRSIFFIV